MMRPFHGLAAVLFVALGVILVACGGSSDEDAATTGGTQAGGKITEGAGSLSGDPVKFGFLNGLTGIYSVVAKTNLEGTRAAVREINNNGGVHGRPVELIIQDNKSTAEGAVTGFQKLVEVDKVPAIAGVESDGGAALLERAPEEQIPVICPYCGTPILNKRAGNYMWRTATSDTDLAIAASELMAKRGEKKIALLAEKTQGTESTVDSMKAVAEKQGDEIVADVRFDPGKTTYQAEVQQVASADPDAVYISTSVDSMVGVLREWQRRGHDAHLYLSPEAYTGDVLKQVKLDDGSASVITSGFDHETDAYKHFEKLYVDQTGKEPSDAYGEGFYYDSIMILALAANAASELNGSSIEKQIPKILNPPGVRCSTYKDCIALQKKGKQIDFTGSSGPLDMNQYGNLAKPRLYAADVVDGTWKTVESIVVDPSLAGS